MKRYVILLALTLASTTPSMAQEFPKPTAAGAKALEDLVVQCVAAGGLKFVEDAKTGRPVLALGDETKLKVAVEGARPTLTPVVLDALIAWCARADRDLEATLIALLRVAGEIANDIRAGGFAAMFEGQRRGVTDQSVAFLEDAARRFRSCEERAWQAACHNKVASVFRQRGEFVRAIEAHRMALGIRRATLGERHPRIADSYYNIANDYKAQGEHAKSLEMYLKALEIYREALGEKHPNVAVCYEDIAEVYRKQGEQARALEMYLKALEIRRATLGGRHPDVGAIYCNIGNVYSTQGEYSRAREMHFKALEIALAVRGERHPDVAACYYNIGDVYRGQGENARALEMFLKALEIQRAALGEGHPSVALSYCGTGDVYYAQGENFRALELFLKALEIQRAALGDRNPHVANSYNNIAAIYAAQGENARALEMYLKALEIRRATLGGRHPDLAASYNNIGCLYSEQGGHARGLEAHLEALKIGRAALGECHPDVANSYHNIGMVYSAQGEHAMALEAFFKALEIQRAALGGRHPDVAACYYNIGGVYGDQGKHAKALEAYGCALVALGIKPKASERDDASQVAPTPSPLTPRILLSRGQLRELLQGPDPIAALSDYHAAADALDCLRDFGSRDQDKLRNGEQISDLFPRAVGVLARLAALEGRAPLLEAISFAERGTARVFLEGLGRSRASAGGRVDAATLAEEAGLTAEIRRLDGRIAKAQGEPSEKRDKEAVERLFLDRKRAEEAMRSLVARMERQSPQYAALKRPRPCSIAEARACLADDEVALLYVLGSEASYLLVVSARDDAATGGIAIHTLASSGTIDEAVAALTESKVLEDADTTHKGGAAAYKMLLSPAAEAIAGKRLVIVPGGVLGRLPFELLVEPDKAGGDGRFLVQGHSIRYAPSLTALHHIRRWEGERPEAGRALWAMGDPVYSPTDSRLANAVEPSAESIRLANRLRGEDLGATFERLAGTGLEVERIAGLMGSKADERLLGPDATEAAVKRLSADGTLAKYRYVHFACHGVLGNGKDVQPGLVLSQVGNPEGQDGYLRLVEVTDLRLNADLVALSACQTGQGKVFRAEGVSGLARAFLYAGSRGVLCSHWKVDDEATAGLMADLYANLKAGQPSADALRTAQLKMIEAGEPPLHWAPFVLIGR